MARIPFLEGFSVGAAERSGFLTEGYQVLCGSQLRDSAGLAALGVTGLFSAPRRFDF
jgi:hypothetical protein